MVTFKRRWHRNQESICRQGFGHRLQVAAVDRVFHHFIQVGFNDMDRTTVNGIHRMLVNIYAHHFFLAGGKRRRRWQTDVTQADNRNSVKTHSVT
ncbi:hypothetical protein D3C78_1091370 [compost metagenome]